MTNNNYNKQFNIPGWVKGDTLADEAASINKKFEDRTSPDALRTKEALLKSIADKQEYIKMQEALKTQSQVIPDQMNGEIPEGMEQFAWGGKPNLDGQEGTVVGNPNTDVTDGGFRDMSDAQQGSTLIGAAGGVLDIGREIFGDPNIDVTGATHVTPEKSGMGAASGALKGASTGAAFGPLGAGVGAVVGGIGGLIGAGKQRKAANLANHRFAQATASKYGQSDFAYGGAVKKYGNGGITSLRPTVKNIAPQLNENLSPMPGEGFNPLSVDDFGRQTTPIGVDTRSRVGQTLSNIETAGRDSLNWLGKNAGEIARFAPIAGNLLNLSSLKKAPTQRGTRLAGQYKEYIPDEARQMNQLNQFNTERALTESSGGDIGALRSNLLATQINKLKGKSAVMANIDKIKAAESAKAQQFDRQKDITNLAAEERFLERSAQDKAAYETTKEGLKKAVYEDIGAVGKESQDKKIVEKMFGYKWNAEYKKYEDSEGNFYSREETQKKIDEKKKADKAEYDEYLKNKASFQAYLKNKTD